MARVLKSPESLKKAASSFRHTSWRYLFYGLLGLTLGLLIQQAPAQEGIVGKMITNVSILGVVFLFFMFVRFNKARQQAAIYAVGQEGEKRLAESLEELPDEYFLIHDINIKVDNKKSQLDHVVIGPNGIFVIESKNLNGTIIGKETDDEWLQKKVGRKGGEYSKTFYNPTHQVKTHVYRLKEVLKRGKLTRTWIQPVVVFTNDDAEIKVNTSEVPVKSLKGLAGFIKNYRGQNHLSLKERRDIAEFLLKSIA